MKRMLGFAALALLVTGCATSSSVKEQIDKSIAPLNDRISALEKQNSDTQAQVADANRKLDAQAGNLQTAQRDVAEMKDAAQKAQQAAADAQAAATRAETAADKAAKAFELSHRKGAK